MFCIYGGEVIDLKGGGGTVHNRFGEICKLSSEVHEDDWEIK